MKIHPVADRILVRRLKEKEMSSGAAGSKVVIPETAKEASQMGVVVAVGPGRIPDGPVEISSTEYGAEKSLAHHRYADPVVAEGDKVLFGRFSGVEVNLNQEVLFLLRQDEIIAVLEAAEDELTDVVTGEVGDA